jgi:hypothetical protein
MNRRILKQLIRTRYNNIIIIMCVCVIIRLLKTSKSLKTQFTAVAPLAEGQFLKNGVTRNTGKFRSLRVGAVRPAMWLTGQD